ALQAAWTASPDGTPDHAEVLVLGTAQRLPFVPEGLRFWGSDFLIPLGFRSDPDLPPAALRAAVGASADELAVFDQNRLELIARAVFRPLHRAGIRLAHAMATDLRPKREART